MNENPTPLESLLDPLQVEEAEQGLQGCRFLVHRPIDLAMIDFMTSLVPP